MRPFVFDYSWTQNSFLFFTPSFPYNEIFFDHFFFRLLDFCRQFGQEQRIQSDRSNSNTTLGSSHVSRSQFTIPTGICFTRKSYEPDNRQFVIPCFCDVPLYLYWYFSRNLMYHSNSPIKHRLSLRRLWDI